MIRKLTLALCFLVLMSSAVAAKTLVVAGHCGYPPMEYLNDKKVPTGYSIDYIKEVAKRAGFDMKFRDVAWDGIFAGLASGNYDILASSTTITPERQKTFDFSDPYYGVVQAVVMAKGKVVADGAPKEVFQDVEGLKAVGLTVPQTTQLLWELRQEGLNVPLDALSDEECAAALRDLLA